MLCKICKTNKSIRDLSCIKTADLTKYTETQLPFKIQMIASDGLCNECWNAVIAGMSLKVIGRAP